MLHTPRHAKSSRQPASRVKFPGITTDAAILGVGRGTLWRVLTGEWPGKSLTARYRALKKAQRAAARSGQTISVPLAAAPSGPALSPFHLALQRETLAPRGLTLAVVQLAYSPGTLAGAGPGFESTLGVELASASLGSFYEIVPGNPILIYYNLPAARLTRALNFLRKRLAALGILPLCNLYTASLATRSWRRVPPLAPEPITP